MIIKNSKPLAAISYETATFKVLSNYIHYEDPSLSITRINPSDFISSSSQDYQYINLITKDFVERKLVSSLLDERNHDRFSYLHNSTAPGTTYNNCSIGPGSFLYQGSGWYNLTTGKDCIIHGGCAFAENVSIGNGSFLSGFVLVGGNVKIGNFCFISTDVLIMDNVTICDDTKIGPRSAVRKSITSPGVYVNPYALKIKKIK